MSENIQVPQGWEVKKLGEVVEINKLTLKDNTDPNYKFTYIDLSSINKGNVTLSNEELFFKNAPSRARRIIEEDNIIIATVRPNLQGFAYIDFPCKDYIVSTGFAVLSYKNNIYMKFLYNMFYSNILMGQINAIITGSNYPAINSNDIKNFSIPVPPLEEQKKIAEILSLWDKAIEQTKELIAYKEKQKKGLMQALLTGKKRLNGFTDEWKTYKLKELLKECNIRNKNNIENNILSVSNKYGFIKQTDFFDKIVASKDTCNYKIIYINQFAYNPSRINVGSIALLKNYESGILSPMYIVFECINELYNIYFNYWIQSYLFMGIIKSYLSGSVRDSLNFKDMARISITIPPLDEQKAIADILSSADEEIELLNKQLELYTEQKKGLMQNLLTGKVRV